MKYCEVCFWISLNRHLVLLKFVYGGRYIMLILIGLILVKISIINTSQSYSDLEQIILAGILLSQIIATPPPFFRVNELRFEKKKLY